MLVYLYILLSYPLKIIIHILDEGLYFIYVINKNLTFIYRLLYLYLLFDGLNALFYVDQ